MDTPPVDIVDRVKVVEVQSERCDACSQLAYVFAQLPQSERLPNGGSVSYCCHHGARFIGGLQLAGALIIDLRHTYQP